MVRALHLRLKEHNNILNRIDFSIMRICFRTIQTYASPLFNLSREVHIQVLVIEPKLRFQIVRGADRKCWMSIGKALLELFVHGTNYPSVHFSGIKLTRKLADGVPISSCGETTKVLSITFSFSAPREDCPAYQQSEACSSSRARKGAIDEDEHKDGRHAHQQCRM